MKFKDDIEMWHIFSEVAEKMKEVANFQEIHLIGLCKWFSYDNGAFEEYCNCPDIERGKDFNSKEECYKCPFYRVKETV